MGETFHFWFNVVEAGVWLAISMRFLLYGLKRKTTLKKAFVVFSITLFFFGLSDVIETQTGAWYRPWTLLLLNAVCVLLISGCMIVLFRNRSECERVMNGWGR